MSFFKTEVMASAALCALLAACASKPLYPTDQTAPATPPGAAPAPPPAPIPPPVAAPTPGAPLASPTARIESSPLPPPPGMASPPAPSSYPPPYPEARAVPAPPRTTTVTVMVAQRAPGSGPVKVEEQPSIKVKKGDTLVSISHKTGIYVADLADANDLKEPYRLKLGSEIKVPAKRYYLVQSGDTLYSIARRFGLEPDHLAEFNKFDPSKGVQSGQKLNLPLDAKDKGAPKPIMVPTQRTVAAPRLPTDPVEIYQAPPAPPPPPRPYVAQAALAPAPAPAYAAPPQPVTTPPTRAADATGAAPQSARPVAAAPVAAPPPRPTAAPPAVVAQVVPPSRPTPAAPTAQVAPPPAQARPAPPPAATPPADSADASVAAAGRGLFAWPVRGEMLSTFGPHGATVNAGIDLGATRGDSVHAAASGEVVYAGSAVQEFGNLVLIKHADGWVTAYGHLASINVKMRQQVSQGQEIGLVGATGTVDRPELHFEVRYAPTPQDKARPIDPMLVLPVQ